MRQIVAIVFLSFAAVCASHAADDDVQKGIFNSYLKQAAAGDAVAQYVVAQSYENGRGTEKNLEQAYHWYEMAAKQNYPLAVVKIEERDRKEQAKAESAKPVKPEAAKSEPVAIVAPVKHEMEKKPEPPHRKAAANPKAKPETKLAKAAVAPLHAPVPAKASKPAPAEPIVHAEPPKQEIRFPTTEVVAKAPVAAEPPRPAINVTQTLLNGQWKRNHQDAELLPSAHAACLQSSATEVVCFSQELTRNVDNHGVTYSVKSIISGIDNKDARFNLRYVYNVVDISDKPYSPPSGMSGEVDDMAVKTGWQQPGVSMECNLHDQRSLTCVSTDRKMTYQFVHE